MVARVIAESFVRVDGTGEPLLLVHGLGLDHTMWDPVMDMLTTHRMVVRYDLLGHGDSHDPPGPRTLDDFVGQAIAVINAIDVDKTDIAGLSIGALIVGAVASRHPDRVGKVALLNSVFDRSEDDLGDARQSLTHVEAHGMGSMVQSALDRWFTGIWQTEHPEAVSALATVLLDNDVSAYAKAYEVFIAGDPEMPGAAASIAAETLVMTGELDVGSTVDMTHALAAVIPNATARILPSVRHIPPVEAPRSFSAALLDFFEPDGIR
jgi:pimeloyl-ACP methyl ester carboxylesterase